jgi:hypothetical protein
VFDGGDSSSIGEIVGIEYAAEMFSRAVVEDEVLFVARDR